MRAPGRLGAEAPDGAATMAELTIEGARTLACEEIDRLGEADGMISHGVGADGRRLLRHDL